MDRIDAMRVFTRIVERRSFTAAAKDLDLPRSSVTDAVKQLESRLGVRLLQRTTRHVSPTLDGEAYFQRCLRLLADFEEAEAAFAGTSPKGVLRVDVQGQLARRFLFPALPAFLAQHPGITLQISEGDRLVDLVREASTACSALARPQDSEMVARRVARLAQLTLAAPPYLARHGNPVSIESLGDHRMVGFRSTLTGGLLPLEFMTGGVRSEVMLPAPVSVSGAESLVAACRLGLGLIQVPRYHVEEDLLRGTLVSVLPEIPHHDVGIAAVPSESSVVAARRVFLDWVSAEFAKHRGTNGVEVD
jgi:DNA-binding transcriptional LysR family regulator